MATFFSNQVVGNWSGYTMYGTLTGNVGRYGNTVTLSSLNLSMSATSAWGTDNNWWVRIYSGDSQLCNASGLTMNNGSGSKGLPNASVNVAASATSHTFNLRTSDGNRVDFTVTFPSGASPPTGPAVSVGTITWDTINITGSVTSWGDGNSNTKLHLMATVPTATTYSGAARAGYTYATTDKSKSIGLTNSNKWSADGGLNIVGCTNFKAAMLAESTNGNVNAITSRTYWTPPAPTTTITKVSETPLNDTQNSVVIRGVGTTENNASGAKIHRIYRVSTNGTWGDWQSFDPFVLEPASTAQETTITVQQNANIIIEVKERYYEDNDTSGTFHDSVETQYSFISAMETPTCTSTWNDVRDTVTITAKSTSTAHNKIRIEWGYTSSFEMGTLVDSAAGATQVSGTIQYPNHGTEQRIYYRAKLLKIDSTWVNGSTMQRTVLNPVLGVCTLGDGTRQYIVDVREKKKNQSTLTSAWQNGQRVVKK